MNKENSLIEQIGKMKAEIRQMVLQIDRDYNVQVRNIDFAWRLENNKWNLKVNVKVGI